MTTELQSMHITGCMSQKTLQLHKIRRGVIRSQQGVSWNPRVVGKLLSLSLSRPLSSSSTQLSHAPLCLTAGFLSLITVYVLSQNSDLMCYGFPSVRSQTSSQVDMTFQLIYSPLNDYSLWPVGSITQQKKTWKATSQPMNCLVIWGF